jgi:hypothetical protein
VSRTGLAPTGENSFDLSSALASWRAAGAGAGLMEQVAKPPIG